MGLIGVWIWGLLFGFLGGGGSGGFDGGVWILGGGLEGVGVGLLFCYGCGGEVGGWGEWGGGGIWGVGGMVCGELMMRYPFLRYIGIGWGGRFDGDGCV